MPKPKPEYTEERVQQLIKREVDVAVATALRKERQAAYWFLRRYAPSGAQAILDGDHVRQFILY